ncbi:guanine nucleotide binding protein, alpha subunit [Mrakia frigida]|uniref:guanine nucleotide-binding protein subunit alpha n=1 Tax=Mrakia frigida TaxID=29902 RepID=UPI003FCC1477
MGICGSSPSSLDETALQARDDKVSRERNRSIEKGIRADEKRRHKEIKILMLGAGGSGKSTVLKVMRLLHSVPFSELELADHRALVYRNLIEGLHLLLDLCEELGIPLDSATLPSVASLSEISHQPDENGNYSSLFAPTVKDAATAIWSDPGLQVGWTRAREAAVPENLPYLMANIERFFEPGYVPNECDILHTRAKTTGISETFFQVRDHKYNLVDVGGQRSERRKWLHCFQDVDAILFVVNLAGYDECLVEDRDANQTREALLLFQSILSNPLFLQTSFLLFLNKLDLFNLKLPTSPIHPFFSDYPKEDEGDQVKGREFFRKKFLRLARRRGEGVGKGSGGVTSPPGTPRLSEKSGSPTPSRKMDPLKAEAGVYVHFTTAVEKNNMQVVMLAVTDLMVRQSIKEMALI